MSDETTKQPDFNTVNIHGMDFINATEAEVIDLLIEEAKAERGGWVVTANLDILRRYRRDNSFRTLVDRCSFVTADGMPIIWASKLQGTPLPERVAGSTMTANLCAACEKHDQKLFFLGGNEGAAAGAAHELRKKHPQIQIVGTHCPPFGFEDDAEEMNTIRQKIIETKPDFILVGLGSPKQDKLIDLLRSEFSHPNSVLAKAWPGARQCWWLGVGISFSFLMGEVERAPGWMQKFGLEWVHRLLQEPGRLAKRYLVDGIPFALALLIGAILIRIKGR